MVNHRGWGSYKPKRVPSFTSTLANRPQCQVAAIGQNEMRWCQRLQLNLNRTFGVLVVLCHSRRGFILLAVMDPVGAGDGFGSAG